jgi:hypothetical protein
MNDAHLIFGTDHRNKSRERVEMSTWWRIPEVEAGRVTRWTRAKVLQWRCAVWLVPFHLLGSVRYFINQFIL